MSSPYIGEIRIFAGNFAPVGWLFCEGQLLPISQYDVLFNLIGTTYGGDGQSTFALPNLASRVPVHQATGFVLGQSAGEEDITLTTTQMPAHTHALAASTNNASTANAAGNILAQTPSYTPYITGFTPAAAMSPNAVGVAGGSQPHDNMLPFLVVNFIIATEGIYPSPS
jgi:microcystin-dependent protein